MFYPEVPDNANTRQSISQWLGYNHNLRIGDGEFYDCENLSSDNYPLISPRKKRPVLASLPDAVRGLLYTDGDLAYLSGGTLYLGSASYDLSSYMTDLKSEQQMIKFGSYLLIFPLGLYFNTADRTDYGSLGSAYTAPEGVTVTYMVCDETGNALDAADPDGYQRNVTASTTAPKEGMKEGDYWLNTYDGGLYVWDADASMWNVVLTTYVKIQVPNSQMNTRFQAGDAVHMNTSVPDLNTGSIIQYVGEDYLVVTGLMGDSVMRTQDTDSTWRLTIERKVPALNYVCVSANRVWGCYYGIVNGQQVNEIYASKLGDPKNWYCYEGLSSDAYAISLGSDGCFTGCIEYQGYPTFFKENAIYRIYGRYPSEYQLITTNCRGVQDGSYKSLAICGEYLLYKSVADVCIYDGSTPVSISNALGKGCLYYNAVSGACLNKYYISMRDAKGNATLFVYDMDYNLWHKEDSLLVEAFTYSVSGQMYGYAGNKVYGFGDADNMAYLEQEVSEEYVKWYAQTGEMGYEYPDYKYVNRLTLRAYLPIRSEIVLSISYDDGPWQEVGVLRGPGTVKSQSFSFCPTRCDHFRLKLEGHGDVRIYTLTRTLCAESEEP